MTGAWDIMEERIYYKDDNVKVTNLRITCNHITILLDKISRVYVDFKAASLVTASLAFFVCFPLVCVGCFVYGNWGYLGLIPMIAAFAWCRMVFRTYVELKISTGSSDVKILESHMKNRAYIYKIEDSVKEALVDLVQEKEAAVAANTTMFTPSDTMLIKKVLIQQGKESDS